MAANMDLIRAAIERGLADMKAERTDLERQLSALKAQTEPIEDRYNALNYAIHELQRGLDGCTSATLGGVKGGQA